MKNWKNRSRILLMLVTVAITTPLFFTNCGMLAPAFEAIEAGSMELGSALPVDHPPTKETVEPAQKAQLMQRVFVREVLEEVFTSANYPVAVPVPGEERFKTLSDLLYEWVEFRPGVFGGDCDIYSSHSSRDCGGDNKSSLLEASLVTSTMRAAHMAFVCEQILGTDNAVYAVREKMSVNPEVPDATAISEVYSMFRRGWTPEPAVVRVYLDLDQSLQNKGANPMERWKTMILMMCEDPVWSAP